MCLTVNEKLTQEELEKFQKSGVKYVTFYKGIDLRYCFDAYKKECKNFLITYFLYGIVKKGINKTNFKKDDFKNNKEISNGVLHLWTNKNEKILVSNAYLIPVKVAVKDIIAYGNERNVCVLKYNVSDSDYKDAVTAVKNYLL